MSVVDTNLLVHATSKSSPDNAGAQKAIIELGRQSQVAIPRQVLREYLSVMTGRGYNAKPDTMAAAMATVGTFQRMFKLLDDGPRVWDEFNRLTRSVLFAGKQVHDANIVATMLAYGETRLLTYNAKDFRRFQPLIEVLEP